MDSFVRRLNDRPDQEGQLNMIWLNEWMHEKGGRTRSFVWIGRKGGRAVMKQCTTVDVATGNALHSWRQDFNQYKCSKIQSVEEDGNLEIFVKLDNVQLCETQI